MFFAKKTLRNDSLDTKQVLSNTEQHVAVPEN